jgi:transcriptional regulator with PAS, ATPase and Fis domain
LEDVSLLADHFIAQFASLKGKDVSGISPEALSCLMTYDYRGNVRELENIIEHAFVMCPSGVIEVCHLPIHLQPDTPPSAEGGLKMVENYEKELILHALSENDWNRAKTAKALGIHKTTLFRKIQKLGIGLRERDGRSRP